MHCWTQWPLFTLLYLSISFFLILSYLFEATAQVAKGWGKGRTPPAKVDIGKAGTRAQVDISKAGPSTQADKSDVQMLDADDNVVVETESAE